MRSGKVNYGLKRVIILTIVTKITVLLLIWLAFCLLPFSYGSRSQNLVYPAGENAGIWSAYKTWDANHYLLLAGEGYSSNRMSNAFYPLFPFLIGATGYLFGSGLIAGLVISHLFTIAAIIFLYLYVRTLHSEETAYNTCLLLLVFPTGFFMGLVYTEALFLMLAVAFFYFSNGNRALPANVCGFLLPLTRPTGILVAVPAVVEVLTKRKSGDFSTNWKRFLSPLSFVAGFVTYLLLMKFFTGSAMAGFEAQKQFISGNAMANILHPIDFIVNNFINIEYTVAGYNTGIVNRIGFVLYLAVLAFSYRRLNKTLFVYSLILGMIPALSGNLMSYTRYLVVIFPLFICLAETIKRNNMYYYLIPGIALQTLFLIVHSLNYWIA